MPERVTARAFHERDDLPDWRFLLGRIESTYQTDSFDRGADFVLQVSNAAEAAGHHPDIDLRYPGRVHIALTTHAEGGAVTDADVALASTISQLAAEAGIRSDPRSSQSCEVAIDAIDIDAVRPFWREVLGYVDERPRSNGQLIAIVDPARIGPAFWFQQMDEPRQQRNRIHIDVTVPHDVAEERIAAALAAGGRLVSDAEAKAFWVLADPEGNEACVCTWQDRD